MGEYLTYMDRISTELEASRDTPVATSTTSTPPTNEDEDGSPPTSPTSPPPPSPSLPSLFPVVGDGSSWVVFSGFHTRAVVSGVGAVCVSFVVSSDGYNQLNKVVREISGISRELLNIGFFSTKCTGIFRVIGSSRINSLTHLSLVCNSVRYSTMIRSSTGSCGLGVLTLKGKRCLP